MAFYVTNNGLEIAASEAEIMKFKCGSPVKGVVCVLLK